MVVDFVLFFHGRCYWRWLLRVDRPYTYVEQVAASSLFDPTGDRGTASAVLYPVHVAITLFIISALVLTWPDMTVRHLLLVALVSYIVMRAWSGLFFIPEMLAFQTIPVDSAPSAELSARVSKWTFWTWFREPLDIISFLCSLLALYWLKRRS